VNSYSYPPPTHPPRRTGLWIAIGFSVALIVALVLLFWYYSAAYPSGSSRPYFPFFGGFFLVFFIFLIAFFVLRVAFWSTRGYGRYGAYGRRGAYGGSGRFRDPAVMAARQRYARGEITREQYDQIMTDLGRRGRGPGGPLSSE
jgi:uncharacterized membrane protein